MRRMVITCPTAWNFRRKLFVPTWRLCVGIDGSGTTSRCFVYHKVILPTFNPFPASSWARGRRLASDYFVLMFQGLVTDTINYCFSKKKKVDLSENFIFLNCLKRISNWNIKPTTCPFSLILAQNLDLRVHMVGTLHAEIKEKGTSNQGIWLKSSFFFTKIKENGQLSR